LDAARPDANLHFPDEYPASEVISTDYFSPGFNRPWTVAARPWKVPAKFDENIFAAFIFGGTFRGT